MRNIIIILAFLVFLSPVLRADITVIEIPHNINRSSLDYESHLIGKLPVKDIKGLDLLMKIDILDPESIFILDAYSDLKGNNDIPPIEEILGSIYHVNDIVYNRTTLPLKMNLPMLRKPAKRMFFELENKATGNLIYYHFGYEGLMKRPEVVEDFDLSGHCSYTFLNMSYLSAIKSQYLNKLLLSKKTDVGIAVESNTKRGFTKGQTWQCTDVVVLFIENKTYPALVLANDKCDCSLFFPLKSDNLVDEIELNFDVL